MWNGTVLKIRARLSLKNFYWMAFVVCLIASAATSIILNLVPKPDYSQIINNPEEAWGLINDNIFQFMGIYILAMAASVVVGVFVSSPLIVGQRRFFSEASDGRVDISNLLYGFKNNYINVVKVMFLRNLFISLWALLPFGIFYAAAVAMLFFTQSVILPGILISAGVTAGAIVFTVKSLQFFYVEFILARNPGISTKEALRQSKLMTNGEKFSIFMFKLSFIGWIILGAMACGIGVVFVEPYIMASEEMLYRAKTGRINGFDVYDEPRYNI